MKIEKKAAKPPAPSIINPDNEVAPEVLARAIVEVSTAATKLLNSPLKRRAILLLIRDASGVGMDDIGRVLDSAADLRRRYVK